MAYGNQSITGMVQRQAAKVLEKGSRFAHFDRLRTRHFWSSYLFAYGGGNAIAAGPYDIYKTTPSGVGQGYPGNTTLTLRETNWRNSGRVPDNQNFVISEIGVTVRRPQPVITATAPADSIYANLPAGIQALINPSRVLHPQDYASILYGTVLEMQYLTNSIPMGLAADFSQSAGQISSEGFVSALTTGTGDPKNGIAAASFRRKFEVPILLQHGETMGMRLNIPRAISTLTLANGGAGWAEIFVEWWAYESFVEAS